jgi:uncharacterized protein YyaL (SSP411 family)
MGINELAKKLNKKPLEIALSIKKLKQKLKQYRNKTRKIPRDTKLLAGMNGLTLAAFAKGVQYDKSLKTSGEKLSAFLLSLWNGKVLRRSAANAKSGTLYDYAAVSWGLIHWGIATGDSHVKQTGETIAKIAWEKFYKNKSWVENPNSLLPKGVQQAHIPDSSLISAEALLLEASMLSKKPDLQQKVNSVLKNITRSLETDLYSYASLLAL